MGLKISKQSIPEERAVVNTNRESLTRIQCTYTTISNTNETDLDSTRYDFKHSFQRTRNSTMTNSTNESVTNEVFSVGEAEFLFKFDLKEGNVFQTVLLDTYISSKSNNVTLLNAQIFITDTDGRIVLFKIFTNVQHFKTPQEEQLHECRLFPIHESWLHGYFGEIKFLVTGSILISPGPMKVNQVALLRNKLKEMPESVCRKDWLFDADNKADVLVNVGKREFNVHKAVLSEKSKVFEAMFNSSTQERQNNIITITDLEEDIVEEMLCFIYTDMSPHISTKARELLQVADKYELEKLKLLSEIELTKTIDFDNVCELSNLAATCNARNLTEFTTKYTIENYFAITWGGNWDKLHDMPREAFADVMAAVKQKK